jgi:hypothetical protein
MSRKMFRDAAAQAAVVAHIAQQPKTCEGCIFLQRWPRPQCRGEASEHFRMVRDTYHVRCAAYAVRVTTAPQPVKPEPEPPPRHELVGHAERDKRLRQNRGRT